MKWLWLIVGGVAGWLLLIVRTLPRWLSGRASLPSENPESAPDLTPVDQRAQEASSAATAKAEEAKAPYLEAVADLQATVSAVPSAETRQKRRELLAKIAGKANQ